MARLTQNMSTGFVVMAKMSGASVLIYRGNETVNIGAVVVGEGASFDIAFLPDGSLLLTYTDVTTGDILRQVSKDLGATWQSVT